MCVPAVSPAQEQQQSGDQVESSRRDGADRTEQNYSCRDTHLSRFLGKPARPDKAPPVAVRGWGCAV